jgi:hypothetical protein
MTRGKFNGIQACADANGIIAAAAMDHHDVAHFQHTTSSPFSGRKDRSHQGLPIDY